ncbi:MAG: hypothetical protein U9N59_11290 [Campylobacterota bacterium]|nr:hypothetical protein [Campylobacterota bacterium]
MLDINSDKKAILKVLYKFFFVSLGRHNITYYYTDNIFYFIFPKSNMEQSKAFLSKVNVPRKLSNIIFTFSIGVVQFDMEKDTLKTLNTKCADANIKATEENNGKSNIVYI